MIYGYWRTDKPKEDGFSRELISHETQRILHETDLDTLESQRFPGVDTLLKAMRRTLRRIPNNHFLGTRKGDEYEWLTWRQAMRMAEDLSHGIKVLDLAPEVEGEGRLW